MINWKFLIYFFPTSKTLKGLLTTNQNDNLGKKDSGTPCTGGGGVSKTFAWLHRMYRKTKKWKFWLCIDYGQNMSQWTSNKPLWKKKNDSQLWTPCVSCRVGYRESKQFQTEWLRWFFLVHWNAFTTIKTKLLFFSVLFFSSSLVVDYHRPS